MDFEQINLRKLAKQRHDGQARFILRTVLRSYVYDYINFFPVWQDKALGILHRSTLAEATSGVPQGSLLGPLLSLIYVNDISDKIYSSVRKFADDCVYYRVINDKNDSAILQGDIDQISQWCVD